jgi:hypothetical protein
MRINLQRYSFRFAEQVLNSKLALKREIEDIILDPFIELHTLNHHHLKRSV